VGKYVSLPISRRCNSSSGRTLSEPRSTTWPEIAPYWTQVALIGAKSSGAARPAGSSRAAMNCPASSNWSRPH